MKLEDRYVVLTKPQAHAIQLEVRDYLNEQQVPTSLEKTDPLVLKVFQIISHMSPDFKKILEKRIIGWTVAKDMPGLAYTEKLYNQKNIIEKGLLIINEKTVDKSYTESCGIREASVYNTVSTNKLQCLSTPNDFSALLYAFSYGAGQLFIHNNSFIPYYSPSPESNEAVERNPFSKISWEWDGKDRFKHRNRDMLRWPAERRYYLFSLAHLLDNSTMPDHFSVFKKSKFPSFFATLTPETDWTETFTYLLLEKFYKVKFSFALWRNSKLVDTAKSCLDDNRCNDKRNLLDFYISNVDLFER